MPSKRKSKREKEQFLKTAGIGVASLATIAAGGFVAVSQYKKSKSNKTEDKLENVITPTEE